MLVVARKVGQTILIGEEIEITVSAVRGDQVRLAIKAPRSVSIQRREAVEQVQEDNVAALQAADEVLRAVGTPSVASLPRPVVRRPKDDV